MKRTNKREMDMDMAYIDELNRIRKEQERGVDYVANQAGIPKTTIWSWFYKGAEPTINKFNAALNALGYELRIEKIDKE
jgi:DNA-binding phage protein